MNQNHFDKLQQINLLTSEIDGLYHRLSLKLGLNDSESRVLYALYTNGNSCLLNKIYTDAGISKQTVNSSLRKLEKEKMVRLEPYHGKAKKVFLTEQGIEKANQTVSKIVKAEIDAFANWDEEEIEVYIKFTKKYVETFGIEVKKIEQELME
ncbi:MarR family winged helix-turn-helix transcriptional regulator [Floccifex sp.]|uniref:MarR family winged helix-turn-helix transcriptional regulator n=1 Tax=Floccifex sp. TaxID=2815810 RepID=UPI003F05D0CF